MTAIADETCPVERLVRNSPELQDSQIASWDGRSTNRFLRAVAALHEACPEACTRTDVWGQGMGDYYPSLLGFIGSVAAWRIEARTRPIRPGAVIDRRASMLGGAPWTCDLHPWPWGRYSRRPMSPLVQLNLAELDLGLIRRFPPVLVQVWGDGDSVRSRTIPLAGIEAREPTPLAPEAGDRNLVSPAAFLPEVGNVFLYYRGRRLPADQDVQVGEYLSTGRNSFDLLGGTLGENFFSWSTDELGLTGARKRAKVERALARVEREGNRLIARSRRDRATAYFGGGHDPRQYSYEPWANPERALMMVRSTGQMLNGYDPEEERFGLCIYREGGSLEVTYNFENLGTGYGAGASA